MRSKGLLRLWVSRVAGAAALGEADEGREALERTFEALKELLSVISLRFGAGIQGFHHPSGRILSFSAWIFFAGGAGGREGRGPVHAGPHDVARIQHVICRRVLL